MDRILKAHFDMFRARHKLPPELSELKDHTLFNDIELLNIWRNNRKGVQWHDKESDITLMGAVDDMLVHDNKLIVLDFKTRGYPCKEDTHECYQNQLNIYNFLLGKNGHETENHAFLLFYHPNKVNDDGSVLFDTELRKVKTNTKDAEKLFKDAVACLQSKEPPKEADECGHCGYVRERG